MRREPEKFTCSCNFARKRGTERRAQVAGLLFMRSQWKWIGLAWMAALSVPAGAQVDQQALDPDYCARRDADPRKCTLYDGTPPRRGVLPDAAAIPPGTPLPDAEYCSRRDADPRKCVIYNAPPPDPILRPPSTATPQPPSEPSPPATPVSPAPGLQPAPGPGSTAVVPVAPSSAPGSSSSPASLPARQR